jgi:ribosomal protein S18 acetylase RimI-like enzyme
MIEGDKMISNDFLERFPNVVMRVPSPDDAWDMSHLRLVCAQADLADPHTEVETIPSTQDLTSKLNGKPEGIVIRLGDKLAAYSLISNWTDYSNTSVYRFELNVLPEFREQGMTADLLKLNEKKIKEFARTDNVSKKQMACNSSEVETVKNNLLDEHGYTIFKTWREMNLKDFDSIPENIQLPDGLEFKTPTPNQYRQVYDAVEANYVGEKGASPPDEGEYQEFLDDYQDIVDSWQVIWQGNEIVGQVIPVIKNGIGEIHYVGVRRDQRGKKLGHALTIRAMNYLKEKGVSEIRLDTDAYNPHGALTIYEKLGFKKIRDYYWYRKDFDEEELEDEETDEKLSDDVLKEFGVHETPQKLPGGSVEVSRVGDIVIKHISETSLENNHSPDLAGWIAEFSAKITQDGFRIPKGVPTVDGKWITDNGWTAWTFVEGSHATETDVPQCITAIQKLHEVLKDIPKNTLLDDSHTPWAKAQKWCLGDKPEYVNPKLKEYVDRLYDLRKPIEVAPDQLMHGDLNPENILVAPSLPPAFIDFSPFWGPPELAMAIFANFIGPRKGNAEVLGHFKDLPNFDQMLIRAGIRMLMIMSVLGHVDTWETCPEKKATEIIFDFVK